MSMSADEPILELKAPLMPWSYKWRQNRLRIFEDCIEEVDPGILRPGTAQAVRYDQIAQVAIKRGLAFSDLIIETTGGGKIVTSRLKKDDAEKGKALIHERMFRPVPSQASSAPDVTEQLRKLGELRGSGILTEDEFNAKKADLLGRL